MRAPCARCGQHRCASFVIDHRTGKPLPCSGERMDWRSVALEMKAVLEELRQGQCFCEATTPDPHTDVCRRACAILLEVL